MNYLKTKTFLPLRHKHWHWQWKRCCTDILYTVDWMYQMWPFGPVIHSFTGSPVGWDKARHLILWKILHDWVFSCSFSLKLYNCWWKRHTTIFGHAPLPDVTCFDLLLCRWDTISGTYWKAGPHLKQFLWPYGKIVTRDRFFRVLRFIHFRDNTNEPDKTDENYE
jgi:hypothetical protein